MGRLQLLNKASSVSLSWICCSISFAIFLSQNDKDNLRKEKLAYEMGKYKKTLFTTTMCYTLTIIIIFSKRDPVFHLGRPCVPPRNSDKIYVCLYMQAIFRGIYFSSEIHEVARQAHILLKYAYKWQL